MDREITAENVRRLFVYDPKTGLFTWMKRPLSDFLTRSACTKWNNEKAERAAFTYRNPAGYMSEYVWGKNCLAHRAAFMWMVGKWPLQIDHVNRDRADNRWENLREVTPAENNRNISIRCNNKSGITGVSWCSTNSKWHAAIRIDGRTKHLGRYRSKRDAILARWRAEEQLGFIGERPEIESVL